MSIKVENLSPILCRICAIEKEDCINNLLTTLHNGQYLIDMLQYCLQRSIDKDNMFPLNICLDCTSNLIAAYNFNVQCNGSERKFRDMLEECDSLERKVEVIIDESENDIKPSYFIDCTAINISNGSCDVIDESCTSVTETETKNAPLAKSQTEVKISKSRASLSRRQTYQCYRCKATFRRIVYLRQHMTYHYTDDELWKCSDCKKQFTLRKNLLKHLHKHTNAVCEYCTERTFNTLQDLKQHCLSTHNDRLVTHKCELCPRKFILNAQLLIHMHNHRDNHDRTQRYDCTLYDCTETFATETLLKGHIRNAHTTYLCSECGKTFKNNALLASHQKVHNSDKPFVCTHCPSRFKWKVALTYHMTIHQKERKHVCETCGLAFTTRSAMKGHMRIHTGERPFACDKCTKRFYRSTHLTRHYLSHTGEKPYKCQFCDKGFRQSAQLNKHLRSHVGENTYQCNLCPINFRLKVDLKKHFHEHYQSKNSTTVVADTNDHK